MSNFDKMIKLIKEKDIKGMEEWLHPDFLFVVDYEMETREEWLKDTERLFGEEDYYSIPNIKLLYEDENVMVHQGRYNMLGIERTPVSTTHFRDSTPWSQLVNSLSKG